MLHSHALMRIHTQELCESLEDGLVDLVDYLYRKISLLLKEEVPVADQQSREEVVKVCLQLGGLAKGFLFE